MERCIIIGAGEVRDIELLHSNIESNDYIIAVDNGLEYVKSMGLEPNLILGDFDSYKGIAPSGKNVLRYKSEKDDSDTMLALKTAIECGYKDIVMAGMLGGRLDHTFANIQAAVYAAKRGINLVVWDRDDTVRAIVCGTLEIRPIENHMVSVFSYTDVSYGVTIENAKYLLQDYTLSNDIPIGVSNEFLDEKPFKVSVKDGILLVITSKIN